MTNKYIFSACDAIYSTLQYKKEIESKIYSIEERIAGSMFRKQHSSITTKNTNIKLKQNDRREVYQKMVQRQKKTC